MQFSLVISHCNITFLLFRLSQGSVATLIRWGGWSSYCHMYRSSLILTVKTALKSVDFSRSDRQKIGSVFTAHGVVAVSQTLRRWTEGATCIWQGGHHVGHWPTFLVLSSFFLFLSRLISAVAEWMSAILFYTRCGPGANLECRSEMCCAWLAGNAGPTKSPKIRRLRTIAQLCWAIPSQLRHVSTIGEKLLNGIVPSHVWWTSAH